MVLIESNQNKMQGLSEEWSPGSLHYKFIRSPTKENGLIDNCLYNLIYESLKKQTTLYPNPL